MSEGPLPLPVLRALFSLVVPLLLGTWHVAPLAHGDGAFGAQVPQGDAGGPRQPCRAGDAAEGGESGGAEW